MKPLKRGFEWWFGCASSTGYLCKFDFYPSQEKDVKVNLVESVVIQLSQKLRETYCTLFSDNSFNSPALIDKILRIEFTP